MFLSELKLSLVVCALSSRVLSAHLHRSLIPEDPHAFPKYHVAFLNGLPVINATAQRWLRDGLQGGELEFLDEPWHAERSSFSNFRGIDGAGPAVVNTSHNLISIY